MKSIALISTPWPLFNRPSIQLGTLKAFLKRALPTVQVEAHHVYLGLAQEIGYSLYGEISERTWLSETPYAALLYPERHEVISRFWARRTSGTALARRSDFKDLCMTLKKASLHILDRYDWDRLLLAGFSVCLGQLTSSLYFIRQIKKRAPSLRIVIGGSACAGEMGESLLENFPEIDYVIRGEGELPLLHLVRLLSEDRTSLPQIPIPGLISRDGVESERSFSQISDLDDLPMPDYTDYFRDLLALAPKRKFSPRISMEISRGCWWRRSSSDGSSGCAFCNLNLQWHGYRAKSNDRVVKELDSLTRQYRTLSVSFMDNLLPPKGLEELFASIGELEKDFRLFSELRATTPRQVLEAMGAAGMRQVQVGIESLSTGLLKKLNKGTTAMDNLEIMRNCESRGLPDLFGNLILEFPSSGEQDVTETMKNLEFAFPFRPLKGIPFWLGYGSPVFLMPKPYGIKPVGNHPFLRHLFPEEILRGLTLMIQGYRGGLRRQHRLWQPVRKKLKEWQSIYHRLHCEKAGSYARTACDPILSYYDGREFTVIRHRQCGTYDMTHRLEGTSRKIFLFCNNQRSMTEILHHFPGFGEDKVSPFLQMMVEKRLMFNEGDRYLSLPVPNGGRRDPE